jgi:flagellar biosynthesis anti-sigma factor FlgM
MNIDRVNISNNGIDRSQGTQTAEPARAASGKDRQTVAGLDSVGLSSRANEFNLLSNLIGQSRADRLSQVRAQLESGSYRVSADDLAQKLIDSNRK